MLGTRDTQRQTMKWLLVLLSHLFYTERFVYSLFIKKLPISMNSFELKARSPLIDGHAHVWSNGATPFPIECAPPADIQFSQAENLLEKINKMKLIGAVC
jgi:hypothetical protein